MDNVSTTAIISIVVFVAIIAFLVTLRVTTKTEFEIKGSDIVLAVVPVVLFLLVTGKIESFRFGDFEVKTVFSKAAKSDISSQIIPLTGLPLEPVQVESKGGVGEIPQLIEGQTEALQFQLGHGGYYGPAINQYFVSLSAYSFFRYILINSQEGTFFGIVEADKLIPLLMSEDPPFDTEEFAQWLNASDQQAMRGIPGFVSIEDAIDKSDKGVDKGKVLERMEDLKVEILPVIDANRQFVGVVDRSKLATSLIIEVTRQLRGK